MIKKKGKNDHKSSLIGKKKLEKDAQKDSYRFKYIKWLTLASSYFGSAYLLAKEIRNEQNRGTHKFGLIVPLYLFRHGLELAVKSYGIIFSIPIIHDHDIELIGVKISELLPTLNTEDLEDADELVELKLPDDLKLPEDVNLLDQKLTIPQWRIMRIVLKAWKIRLPEIVEKYKTHSYVSGVKHKDPKNMLLRYPDNTDLQYKVEGMTDIELDQVLTDIYDQLMLLQLILAIQLGQSIKK